MSLLLKESLFSENQFNVFTEALSNTITDFPKQKFLKQVFDKNWNKLELKERMRHTTQVLHNFLPKNFSKAAEILIATTKFFLKKKQPDIGFVVMSMPDYVELYGIEYFDISVKVFEEVTKLISCEFAVRPFIIKYRAAMMKQMLSWSQHEHQSIRRFASEGCRPRLPWAIALAELKKDPSEILPILENLKADSSEFVRKSVANNLNDISKDNADIALSVFKKWKGFSVNTDKIVKHACRTLLKAGNMEAMKLFGYASMEDVSFEDFNLEKENVRVGEELKFSFKINNISSKTIVIRLEFAMYYLRANGKLNKKVFKISENEYLKNTSQLVKKKYSFKAKTTRKYYPGKQKISIIVNGNDLDIREFVLEE